MQMNPLPRISSKENIAKKCLLRTIAAIFCVFGLLILLWTIAPLFVDDPMPKILAHTPARVYYDTSGIPIRYERTYDFEWRFPIKIGNLPPHLLQTFLATEDRNFYHHSGVDYMAVLRAAWQDMTSLHIISGASTISMQLAGMSLPSGCNRIVKKIRQAVLARKIESLYDKDFILEEYINRICYGGKIYGIQAAAQYYFGRSAKDLNAAEASLLCGLPQKPNKYRPDRYPETARSRQKTVLDLMVRNNLLSQEEADDIRNNQPLRYRDFTQPPDFMLLAGPDEMTHYLDHAKKESDSLHPNDPYCIQCTIDLHLQNTALNILKKTCELRNDVHDGAAVILEAKTGNILAYVSTLDFKDKHAGQVNAITGFRSAGSTLKPFLYAEAIEAGWITKQTIIQDAPILYGDYSPGNFDGTWQKRVSVTRALVESLNTPAVQIAARLGITRLQDLSNRLHWQNKKHNTAKVSEAGLSFALGTAGNTLASLTDSYRIFATEGNYTPSHFVKNKHTNKPEAIFQPGTCRMISDILLGHQFDASELPVAWKSGTSSNTCDAWCFAWTPDYVLGVWFGNKNGTPSTELVGVKIAVPAAAEIMDFLYRNSSQPIWGDSSIYYTDCKLCRKTGLTATPDCEDTFIGSRLRGIPLSPCSFCTSKESLTIQIYSPQNKDYIAENGISVLLELTAKTKGNNAQQVQWFIDGAYFKDSIDTYSFSVGRHTVQAIITSDTGDFATDSVTFSVSKP